MLKKTISIIFALLLVLGCFSGCTDKRGAEAGIVYPIDNDPQYLDPQIISDTGARNIIANCFEGLVTIGENGEILPGCAESWSISDDSLTYTFFLRKNCKWRVSIYASPLIGLSSDITNTLPVTADDFVFGLRRALSPETRSPGATALLAIKNASEVNSGKLPAKKLGVKAINDKTVEITLEREDPDFLYTLTEPACMPCNEEFFEATGGRYGLAVKYLIYNGPFYINNWVDDVSLSIRKNTTYYDSDNVMPRSVYYSIFDQQETRLGKLKDKTYSVSPLSHSQAQEIADSKKYTVSSFPSKMMCLLFNCSDESLSNINIRRALTATFDYESLKEGFSLPLAKGIIPCGFNVGSLKYRQAVSDITPYSSKQADDLFKKGLRQLEKNDIEISILCLNDHEALIRRLMQSWQSALGIECAVFVEATDKDTLEKRIKTKDYQLAFTDITFTGNTAFGVLETFTSESPDNIIGFEDKGYDKLVNSVKRADNAADSINKMHEAEEYLIKNAAIIPLYEMNVYQGQAKGVSGTFFNLAGDVAYFKYTLSR